MIDFQGGSFYGGAGLLLGEVFSRRKSGFLKVFEK